MKIKLFDRTYSLKGVDICKFAKCISFKLVDHYDGELCLPTVTKPFHVKVKICVVANIETMQCVFYANPHKRVVKVESDDLTCSEGQWIERFLVKDGSFTYLNENDEEEKTILSDLLAKSADKIVGIALENEDKVFKSESSEGA